METITSKTSGLHRVERPEVTPLTTATNLLKYTYGVVPIIAGLDKFTHLLTNWNKYLAPVIADAVPISTSTFMSIVGIVEVIAGLLVFAKPKLGSLVVSLWLVGIAINLLLTGTYFDIAVRDLVMAIGAFSLYLLLPDNKTLYRNRY